MMKYIPLKAEIELPGKCKSQKSLLQFSAPLIQNWYIQQVHSPQEGSETTYHHIYFKKAQQPM